MILKIRKGKSGWFIRSGILEVTYSVEREEENIGYTIELPKQVCDRHFSVRTLTTKEKLERTNPESCEKCVCWTQILVTFVDGSKEEWLLEVETYLLNDEGKTIERIF